MSSNRGFIGAQHGKRVKRGPQEHIPIEGRHPESTALRCEEQLDAVATIFKQRRLFAEEQKIYDEAGAELNRGTAEWEARRKAALASVDSSPVEVAYLFGYSSDKAVRELRIRHGKDEHSGRTLTNSQRPIISTQQRRRK